jgi:hypothetical protein
LSYLSYFIFFFVKHISTNDFLTLRFPVNWTLPLRPSVFVERRDEGEESGEVETGIRTRFNLTALVLFVPPPSSNDPVQKAQNHPTNQNENETFKTSAFDEGGGTKRTRAVMLGL